MTQININYWYIATATLLDLNQGVIECNMVFDDKGSKFRNLRFLLQHCQENQYILCQINNVSKIANQKR